MVSVRSVRRENLRVAAHASQLRGIVALHGRKLGDREYRSALPAQRLGDRLVVDEVDLDVLVSSRAALHFQLLGTLQRLFVDGDVERAAAWDRDVGEGNDGAVGHDGSDGVQPGIELEDVISGFGYLGFPDDRSGSVDDDQRQALHDLTDVHCQACQDYDQDCYHANTILTAAGG